MDLRVKKTEKAIRGAFYKLIQTKPMEKITVKELAELAEINKTTFYAHYETIYDLVATIEQEITDSVIENLDEFQILFDNPRTFVYDLYHVFASFHTDSFSPFNPSSQDFLRKLSDAIYDEVCRRGFLSPPADGDEDASLPERYASFGTLLTFLINGLFGLSKCFPNGIPDKELEFLATFVESGIHAITHFQLPD